MMGCEIRGGPAGEGELNIDWVPCELDKCGAKPTIILEQWTPWAGNIEETVATGQQWAAQSIQFLGRYR
jgi:L-ribulose-5-phosphate 3-epimerase UlaE